MGHTFVRCKQPQKEEEGGVSLGNDGGFGGESGGGGGGGGGAGGDWDQPATATDSGQPEWENKGEASTFGGEAPVMSVGGGGW